MYPYRIIFLIIFSISYLILPGLVTASHCKHSSEICKRLILATYAGEYRGFHLLIFNISSNSSFSSVICTYGTIDVTRRVFTILNEAENSVSNYGLNQKIRNWNKTGNMLCMFNLQTSGLDEEQKSSVIKCFLHIRSWDFSW